MSAEPQTHLITTRQIDAVVRALMCCAKRHATPLLVHARWLGGVVAEGKADSGMETVQLWLDAADTPMEITTTILRAHAVDPRIKVVLQDFSPIGKLTLWLPVGWVDADTWAIQPIGRSMDLAAFRAAIRRAQTGAQKVVALRET